MKAVILIGGPSKGTRFRPLSLDIPKPLFPIAGLPMIQHHVEACKKIPNLSEILIIGSYNSAEIHPFADEMSKQNCVQIRYLQEFTPLGTAGAMYHFRDQIKAGGEDCFFVFNGDVCSDFPLRELLCYHKSKKSQLTIMATEATRQQSLNYGCLILSEEGSVEHYVEKPSTFVSTLISCGAYIATNDIFQTMADVFYSDKTQGKESFSNGCHKEAGNISLEQDIMPKLITAHKLFAMPIKNWWSQVKTAGSAIYVNRHYLALYRENNPERLASTKTNKCNIIDDVFIHPTASVDPTAVLGPNVSIGADAKIGPGVRIRESIVLESAHIEAHSCILYSIIGRESRIGEWARVEGTPCDPNPDRPFAKMENRPLFNNYGQLNSSATIIGSKVTLAPERILLNSIILPHKELNRDFKNEIVL